MAGRKWTVSPQRIFVYFTTSKKHVTTHPTGCSVFCNSQILIYQPITQPHTHARIQRQFQSRQYAKHRKKKKTQPTGSSGLQIGAKHSGKTPPSLSVLNFTLMPSPCEHMKRWLAIFKHLIKSLTLTFMYNLVCHLLSPSECVCVCESVHLSGCCVPFTTQWVLQFSK